MTHDLKKKISPIILSGGSGSRLWPLSRPNAPKQFLKLISHQSGFEDTLERCCSESLFEPPTVLCAKNHRHIARELLNGTPARIIMEPSARNTAAAICIAALSSAPDALLLIMPSDHYIPNTAAFQETVRRGLHIAENGHIVLFGVPPTRPEIGYGYIKAGEPRFSGFDIQSFHEKPDRETAKTYTSSSDYYWNSGIFLTRADTLVKEYQAYAPHLLTACQKAWDKQTIDLADVLLSDAVYNEITTKSFDFEIMEKTQSGILLPAHFTWDDYGSWQGLYRISKCEHVLKNQGITNKPWGSYQIIQEQNDYKIKRLTINSGHRLSLQKHHKRSEFWVVVNGVATVTKEQDVFDLHVNESAYIPCGMVHRLENKTLEALEIIEVQTGSYLGEDDIIRLENDYDHQEELQTGTS